MGFTFENYLTPHYLLQKKILTCLHFQLPTASSTTSFHSIKILKLEDVFHFNLLVFVYRAMNKISPIYIPDYFTPDSSVHRFGTRQATRGDLFMSLKRTTLCGLKALQYFGSKSWNTLPLFIRVAGSLTTFRSKFKAFFINSHT